MALIVPKGSPDSSPLEVTDDQVDYWSERGYVVQGGRKPTAKKAAKKSAAKRSSK